MRGIISRDGTFSGYGTEFSQRGRRGMRCGGWSTPGVLSEVVLVMERGQVLQESIGGTSKSEYGVVGKQLLRHQLTGRSESLVDPPNSQEDYAIQAGWQNVNRRNL